MSLQKMAARSLVRTLTSAKASPTSAVPSRAFGVSRAMLSHEAELKSVKTHALIGIVGGSLATLTWFNAGKAISAKCETKLSNNKSVLSDAESMYAEGRLVDLYEMLNDHPETSQNPSMLYHLARVTYKLADASPNLERQKVLNDEALLVAGKAVESTSKADSEEFDGKQKAELFSLYGRVIQQRANRKEEQKAELFQIAQEHMTAALREDPKNFDANYALANLSYEKAKARTELGRKSLTDSMAYYDKNNHNKLERSEDQETLWRATSRHAYAALKQRPEDVNCINLMAQSKFAIGELNEAKKYCVRAMNVSKKARFNDEINSVREAKELNDKIHKILG